jgi:hypothetical protein
MDCAKLKEINKFDSAQISVDQLANSATVPNEITKIVYANLKYFIF